MQLYDSISLLEDEILTALSSPSILVSQINHLKFNDVADEFAKQEWVASSLESNEEEDLDEALVSKMFFPRKPDAAAPSPAWTRVAASVFAPFDSEYEQRLHERRAVFAALRQRFVRTKERLAMAQEPVKAVSSEASPVPVMVRLGVLTLFPMVQELKDVQGLNYQRLCRRTLDVIISVLASSGPLGLAGEPRDCVDAFADFIGQQMEACQYAIENEEQAQILVAMIGLAVSRGGSSHVLRVVDCLFKVFARSHSQGAGGSEKQREDTLDIEEHPLDIMTFLAHLKSADELNSILPCYFDESWYLDTIADLSFVAKTSLALDGSYLYLFNSVAGFVKIGTGREETLRGFVYNRRSLSDAIPAFQAENAATQSNTCLAIGPDALFLFTAAARLSEKEKKESANGDKDRTRHSLRIIDKTTLRESGRIFLKSNSGGGVASGRDDEREHVRLVSCGNFVYLISRAVEVTAAQAAANESSDLLSAALTRFEQLRDQLMQMGTLGEAIMEENGIGLGAEASQIEKEQSSDDSSSEDSASYDSAEEEKAEKLKDPVQFFSARQLIPMLGLQRKSKIVHLVECYDVSHLEDGLELEPCKTVTLAQNEQIPSENVLAPNALEEAEFYTNGSELVCLMNARALTPPVPLSASAKRMRMQLDFN